MCIYAYEYVHVHMYIVGSDSIPKELEKFSFPWTQFQQRRPKSGHEGPMKRKALGFTALKVCFFISPEAAINRVFLLGIHVVCHLHNVDVS